MELFRALGSLIEVPAPEHRRIAEALGLPPVPAPSVHGTVVSFQRYPYASVYLGVEGMMGGEARDRIAGFRRALGVGDAGAAGDPGQAPGAAKRRAPGGPAGSAEADPRGSLLARGGAQRHRGTTGSAEADHLAALLALLAALDRWRRDESDPARAALLAEARVTLVWEHIVSWTGPYLASFEGCGSPFHEAWAALLGEALARIEAGMDLPGYLPAAMRDAPGMADPREEGGAALVASLLAPVRSGVILLRDDLVRLGDETGLACRAGERRYVLGAFLAQDPGATLRWLARHARDWGGRVAGRGPAPIARWWADRAAESAALLSRLADGANTVVGSL